MRYFLIALVVVALANSVRAEPLEGATLTGKLRIVDGDTMVLGGARIRLRNAHAPELDEPGGLAAKDYLAALVAGAPVTCTGLATDRYGRVLATCTVRGEDLGLALIAAGMAAPRGPRGPRPARAGSR